MLLYTKGSLRKTLCPQVVRKSLVAVNPISNERAGIPSVGGNVRRKGGESRVNFGVTNPVCGFRSPWEWKYRQGLFSKHCSVGLFFRWMELIRRNP